MPSQHYGNYSLSSVLVHGGAAFPLRWGHRSKYHHKTRIQACCSPQNKIQSFVERGMHLHVRLEVMGILGMILVPNVLLYSFGRELIKRSISEIPFLISSIFCNFVQYKHLVYHLLEFFATFETLKMLHFVISDHRALSHLICLSIL